MSVATEAQVSGGSKAGGRAPEAFRLTTTASRARQTVTAMVNGVVCFAGLFTVLALPLIILHPKHSVQAGINFAGDILFGTPIF
ncbi:hypothetical protein [Streptomyces inhibens]|uniref:hypothetical protein n=1 Tax=Streptomyces inhibens TaxID=2293571 RepID=UPI001EE73330|nr:hypothetical protein [Streptomyces inhibens]UKY47573.1 hypothetical protein KI385_01055 [Streptomyces inhibens]